MSSRAPIGRVSTLSFPGPVGADLCKGAGSAMSTPGVMVKVSLSGSYPSRVTVSVCGPAGKGPAHGLVPTTLPSTSTVAPSGSERTERVPTLGAAAFTPRWLGFFLLAQNPSARSAWSNACK